MKRHQTRRRRQVVVQTQSKIVLRHYLVGPSLYGGGAERRFTNIAKYLFAGQCAVAVLNIGKYHGDELQTKVTDWGHVAIQLSTRLHTAPRPADPDILNRNEYDAVLAFGLFPNLISIVASRCLQVVIQGLLSMKLPSGGNEGEIRKGSNFITSCVEDYMHAVP